MISIKAVKFDKDKDHVAGDFKVEIMFYCVLETRGDGCGGVEFRGLLRLFEAYASLLQNQLQLLIPAIVSVLQLHNVVLRVAAGAVLWQTVVISK